MLKANGQVMHRLTYRPLAPDEIRDPEEVKKREVFTQCVEETCGKKVSASDFEFDEDIETPTYEVYEDDDDDRVDHAVDSDVEGTPETLDKYVGAEVVLPIGNENFLGKVKARKRNQDGTLNGTASQNPILDTRTYEVEFQDGQVAKFGANVVTENMWDQCNLEGK